jgi:hypothetical protein
MGNYVNCEAFQVRANASKGVTVERGLAITEVDGERYIDPQIEPDYNTSLGVASPDRLQLAISHNLPPKVEHRVIKRFSLHKDVIENPENIGDHRAQRVVKGAGSIALVSLVDHFGLSSPSFGANVIKKRFGWYRVGDYLDAISPTVDLLILEPGQSLSARHDARHELGGYFSDVVNFSVTYDPDSEDGLKILHPMHD